MFMLLLNLYFKELGFSESYIGTVLSRTNLAPVILALPLGLVVGRFTFKSLLTFATLVMAVGYAFQVLTGNRDAIILAGFVAGVGSAVFRVSAAPFFMRHSSEKERTYLFSMNFAASTGGAFVGSLIGGFLPAAFSYFTQLSHEQFRYALLTGSIIMTLSAFPFVSIVEEKPDLKAHSRFLTNLRKTDWRLIGKLCVPTFIVGVGAGLIIPFLNLYFKDVFGASAETIGILFAVLQCFMTAGTLVGPLLVPRLGLMRSVVVTQLASIPFMLTLCFSRSFPVVVGAFLMRGALMNMNQPMSTHFAMEAVRKEEHAVTNSMLMLSWTGSWVLSVQWGGILIERYSYVPSFVVAIVLYVVSSFLYYYFFRNVEVERLPEHELELKEA
ncbi:MAG: MFS transporter [Candidatus Eisenbacteria bacterium]|nr:MFS transporter [Candidatus Eisenbacteria bacterium]